VSQLDDKVALVREAMAAGTDEGVRWQANLVRVVDYLHLLARVAPPLRSINQALRVTAIEHVLLHACDTVACQLRSGAKLCNDFKHLPAHYAGFGPFDYILGNGRAVLLNAPALGDEDWPGYPSDSDGESDSDDDPDSDLAVGISACAFYQAVGQGHDLLFGSVSTDSRTVTPRPRAGRRGWRIPVGPAAPAANQHIVQAETPQGSELLQAPYVRPQVSVVISTGRSWRLYQVVAPTVTQQHTEPALYYGGELTLPVPGATQAGDEAAAAVDGVGDAALRLMCLLALAGTGQFNVATE
jgi:hypothetical protein